ncbi:MAG: hypothetical protein LCI00_04940 [Chloroflexi bacterium]|nr:hypothetical protein [Chloroflexota bacterium]MCC6896399.1 hypothetical protein [Anaerolineae bacterium]
MNKKKESRGKAFWPVLGLLLAISAGLLAWVFTNPTIDFLKKNLRSFPPATPTVTLIVGVILFALLILIFSLLVAIAVPKRKSDVNEAKLVKERSEMVRAKAARKIHQREINRQNKAR